MDGLKIFFGVWCFSMTVLLIVVYGERGSYNVKAKKDDCEQVLILRADECKPYYLTTEEIKLIERLGEKQ